mgnify:CR=1 FL=1
MISHDAEAELPLEWTATAAEEKEGTHPSSEEGDGPKVVTSQASDTMQTKSGEEGPSEVEKEVEEVEASSNPGRSPAADPVSEEKEHQEESEQSSGGSGEQSSDKEGGPSSPPADNLRDARAERLEMCGDIHFFSFLAIRLLFLFRVSTRHVLHLYPKVDQQTCRSR